MQAPNQTDERLMSQVALGQRECLEVLVRRYATPLLTYLTKMIGDEHRSEELLQEVFMAVWTKRKTYHVDRPLKPWLYAIANNRCRLAFRKAQGKETLQLDLQCETSSATENPSPDEVALVRERASLVNAALVKLPEQQRIVVILRVWSGMTYSDIATTVDQPETTVRSHMHRALALLRKHLAPAMADG